MRGSIPLTISSNEDNKQEKEIRITARERMVTRTVVSTKAEVLCIDIETAEVTIRTFHLVGKINDEKKPYSITAR